MKLFGLTSSLLALCMLGMIGGFVLVNKASSKEKNALQMRSFAFEQNKQVEKLDKKRVANSIFGIIMSGQFYFSRALAQFGLQHNIVAGILSRVWSCDNCVGLVEITNSSTNTPLIREGSITKKEIGLSSQFCIVAANSIQ